MIQRVALFLLFTTIGAKAVTTHELYDHCKNSIRLSHGASGAVVKHMRSGFCVGYIAGFGHAMEYAAFNFARPVSSEALCQSFVHYLKANPAEIDADDPGLVLIEAWWTDRILVAKPKPILR